MKKRDGLDAIGYLGDVMWNKTDGPIPSMQDWPWRLSNKAEAFQLAEAGLIAQGETPDHSTSLPEVA